MKEKTKEIIVNVVAYIIIIYGLLIIIALFVDLFTPLDFSIFYKHAELFSIILASLMVIFILLLIVLQPKFIERGYNVKAYNAEQILLKVNNFEQFITKVEENLIKSKNKLIDDKEYDNYKIKTYFKRNLKNYRFPEYTFIVSIRELDEDSCKKIKKQALKICNDYRNNNLSIETVNYILVICVNKETKAFDNYVNGVLMQYGNTCILPVGISFDKQIAYISVQKEAYMIVLYKLLKRKVKKLLAEVMEKEQIK